MTGDGPGRRVATLRRLGHGEEDLRAWHDAVFRTTPPSTG